MHVTPPLVRLVGDVAAATAGGTADPDAWHTAGLLDLVWNREAGIALDRSISSLRAAVGNTPTPAAALTDLSAAYLVRAGRTKNVRDLFESLEAGMLSLARDSLGASATFNVALALHGLGLDDQAAKRWRAYLALDSTSGWAREARAHLRDAPRPRPAPAPLAMTDTEARRFALAAPQDARNAAWDHLLGAWAEAVLAEDGGHAGRYLTTAEAIGTTLAGRGGDATVADAVRLIRARAPDRVGTRVLARAHRQYLVARRAYLLPAYDVAERDLAPLTGASAPDPLRGWATLYHAGALVQTGHVADGRSALITLIARVDPRRYPALAGHARWALGTALLYGGLYDEARGPFREAAALFTRAREAENRANVEFLLADAEYLMGDLTAADESIYRAMRTLRAQRRSPWLHNVLFVWAESATTRGYHNVARAMRDEDIVVASAIGRAAYIVEARRGRAALLAATGQDGDLASRDVRVIDSLSATIPSGGMRDRLQADRQLVQGATLRDADPVRAVAVLDSAIDYFTATHNVAQQFPALVARSDAQIRRRNTTLADADLGRALDLLDREHAAITAAPLRATLLEAARDVVDRMVMLRVNAGANVGALEYLERGRVSFLPVGSRRPAREQAPLTAPAGQTVVDYALIGDTLLAWTLHGSELSLHSTRIDRRRLLQLVDRARSALELRLDERVARAELAALHDLLVRPLQSRLGPEGTTLVIVADGELAAVPFAALFDRDRHRYLVEDWVLRFAGTVRDALRRRPPRPVPQTALLVADPAFDARTFPGLVRLAGARAEVDSIADQYPASRRLAAGAAGPRALSRAMGAADVVHYAGHAVFDDIRPERSHLVLAPGRHHGSTDGGRLTAADVERLDLRRVQLVVLSACRTSAARTGHAGGFGGLAGAFMAAGADGVVGSLYEVDDALTRPMMAELHRAYRRSHDGAAAVRAAQLRLLHSPDSTLRAPAAWAAFRYVGA